MEGILGEWKEWWGGERCSVESEGGGWGRKGWLEGGRSRGEAKEVVGGWKDNVEVEGVLGRWKE